MTRGYAAAAPLRAVDTWNSAREGERLSLTVKVGVRGNDPNLRGHFPGLAIFPGVFVIESLCQAIALALPGTPALRSVRSVRFLAPLLHGDRLTLDVTATPDSDGWDVNAIGVRRDGTRAARIRASFGPAESGASEAHDV